MSRNLIRFITVISILFAYTTYKFSQFGDFLFFYSLMASFLCFTVMITSLFSLRLQKQSIDKLWLKSLAWSGNILMGVWSTFILLSLPMDLLVFFTRLFTHLDFTQHEASIVTLGAAVTVCVVGLKIVLGGPKIQRIFPEIPLLPTSLKGLKIIQISDLHIGALIRKNYIGSIVERVNQENPDLIFITGDISDAKTEDILPELETLSGLKAALGVFFVTGNHEYYWDGQRLIADLTARGFTPMINENRILDYKGKRLLIAGVTDPMAAQVSPKDAPDLPKASLTSQTVDLKILLAHRPDVCFQASDLGFDLQFSGHTHAGQFFPFSLLMPVAHKYYRGLHRVGNLWLYVNRGTGFWGPPNRFGSSSEITVVILK